jgi:hypothetical protein
MMAVPQRRGGRRGCLIALLVVAIVILLPIALFLRIPQQLGIFRAHPEEIFNQTPDPLAGAALTNALSQGGAPTDGLRLYVFNMPGSKAHIVYATAALAENFSFRDTGQRDPILDLLGQIATATAADPSVEGIALKVRDFQGKPMLIVTADAADARAYAAGQIDEATFLDRMTGWVDPSVLAQAQLGSSGQ